MRKIIDEPFLHFIIIGIALFILYGLVSEDSDSTETIVINDFEINALIGKWESQWKREPNEKELYGLITQNLHQEIYYREALKMNMDHNDEIIKRRLSQKMKFLTNDLASLNKVNDDDLAQYFEENSSKYMIPTSYSLYQIVFTSDKRKNPRGDAQNVLDKYKNASFDEMKNKADKLPISYFYEDLTEDELRLQLGAKFKEEIKNATVNKWAGPISSGYGEHLVFITKKQEPRLPALETVKNKVVKDYEYDNQQEIEEGIYQELKKSYVIELDIKSKDFDPEFVKLLEEEINK